jgi:hypothetical protein
VVQLNLGYLEHLELLLVQLNLAFLVRLEVLEDLEIHYLKNHLMNK